MAERFTLQPTITGSTWSNVWGALSWERPSRGMVTDDDGTVAPRWTNREAIAVIAAVRAVASADFPLWYQFAAPAYGWEPGRNKLDRSEPQGDRDYEANAAVMLQLEIQRIFNDLDERRKADPRLDIDAQSWTDATLQAEVAKALREDGAQAQFKIPLPACKDPKTGKPARPVKGEDGKWRCPGGPLLIDDPITAIVKALAPIAIPAALILGAAWVMSKRPRRPRRR